MSIVNFYEHLPKKYHSKIIDYKNKDLLKINLPMRGILLGASASGKSNLLLNLISQISAFNKIYLFVKDPEEPLYQFLIDSLQKVEKKTREQIIFYSNDMSDIPSYEEFRLEDNTLCVFDDIINSKSTELARVANLYTMGRKRNVSCLFLSQSYFKIPLIIRQNTDYVFILRVNTVRDLHRILAEYELNATREQIEEMYKISTKNRGDFLLIDVPTLNPDLRFRHNFKGFVLTGKSNLDNSDYEDDE